MIPVFPRPTVKRPVTHLFVERELVLERVLCALPRVSVDQPDVVLDCDWLTRVTPLARHRVAMAGHQTDVPEPGGRKREDVTAQLAGDL